jgi:MFS family permease
LTDCLTLILPSKYGLTDLDKNGQADLSANIVSTLQAGCFFGAVVASPIADRWGRKPALMTSAVVVLIGAILQAAAEGHLAAMYVGR